MGQAFKNELNRITEYVTKLAADTKILDAANGAAQKMTTHAEADAEVAALLPQGGNVDKDAQAFKNELNRITEYVSDEWVKKVDILLKEWTLLDNTVTELNSWVAKDKSSE